MQAISEFLVSSLDSIMRQDIICDFIEELRAARSLPAFPPAQLESAGFAWDRVLSPIPVEYLQSRDEQSLFVAAARQGTIEAAQVWAIWLATTGGQIRLADESQGDAQTEAGYRDQKIPVGEGRKRLQNYLAERGISLT